MVMAALRRQFGAPVGALSYVKTFMSQKGADHLRAAIHLMKLGLNVWLLTDYRTTFVMDSDLEFTDMLETGFLRTEGPSGYVLLPINPVVKRLVAAMKEPTGVTP